MLKHPTFSYLMGQGYGGDMSAPYRPKTIITRTIISRACNLPNYRPTFIALYRQLLIFAKMLIRCENGAHAQADRHSHTEKRLNKQFRPPQVIRGVITQCRCTYVTHLYSSKALPNKLYRLTHKLPSIKICALTQHIQNSVFCTKAYL